MKIPKYYLLFLTGIIIFLTATAYLTKEKNEYVEKENNVYTEKVYDNSLIIKFNHALHTKDAELACQDCHTKALTSTSSKDNLNPLKKDCASCHDVKDEKECNLCHYDGVYKKLRSSNTDLFFSHKEHINSKGDNCTECHKGLDNVKFSKESSTAFPDMESCYTCHDNVKASNSCES